MSQADSTALSVSRILLKILRILNIGTGLGLVIGLPASFLFEPTFFEFFSKKPPSIDPAMLLPALRVWMVMALLMVALVHVQLSRLLSVVATVPEDPFVPENAARLKTIAWCMLGIELLRLTFGILAGTMNAAGSNIDWKFSASGWVAVVLLFVLAQVFEAGARMRADLDTMI
ncbi:DUF2975 domain-containing protein [Lysobacter sp. S4-A87]|uniref:DUF2975 domain-containing protein n=1 Tax=Lysobacter sp. S4-A87 TaxID=2925843 RepID=UPI001F5387ED|nr:DUF2975 domain-containing protein [Lysobacter sp. S4-A87]UNK49804.1 DUF2975 domain-containing protein [Lysobacter sp. S4-A87]